MEQDWEFKCPYCGNINSISPSVLAAMMPTTFAGWDTRPIFNMGKAAIEAYKKIEKKLFDKVRDLHGKEVTDKTLIAEVIKPVIAEGTEDKVLQTQMTDWAVAEYLKEREIMLEG